MSAVLDGLSWVLLSLGAFFCVVGGLGIVRFPDFYTRVHAAGITDTMGAGLVILGLMCQSTLDQVMVKLVLVMLFLAITGPTATHALVKAAHGYGTKLDLPIPERALEPAEDPFAEGESSDDRKSSDAPAD